MNKEYPSNWSKLRVAVYIRDKYTCQHCFLTVGEFYPATNKFVVLNCCHLDHLLINHDIDNLITLCQKCHYKYDLPYKIWDDYKKKSAKVFDLLC